MICGKNWRSLLCLLYIISEYHTRKENVCHFILSFVVHTAAKILYTQRRAGLNPHMFCLRYTQLIIFIIHMPVDI
jgi:hypothetical protein